MRRNWTVETFAQNQYFNNYQCMRICGTRDASAAIDVINNVFSFVGLLEHYDESLVLMKFLLGDDSFDNRYEQKNTSTESMKIYKWKELSEQQKELVYSANKEDEKLYNYVLNEYYPCLKDKMSGLSFELKKFKEENKNYVLPLPSYIKSKISNYYLTKFVQPLTTR